MNNTENLARILSIVALTMSTFSLLLTFVNLTYKWWVDKWNWLEDKTAIKKSLGEITHARSYIGKRTNVLFVSDHILFPSTSNFNMVIEITSVKIYRNRGLFQREYFVYNENRRIKLIHND